MSREAKVGIFVLIGILLLTYFTFRIGKMGGLGGDGYTLTVDFETAAGLEPKAAVRMAGVPIGTVEEIQLVGTKARLVLRINPGVSVPIDSVAAIQTQGLLGENYVAIVPGKPDGPKLPAGGKIAQTIPPTNLDAIFRKVDAIGDDIKSLTGALSSTIASEDGKKSITDILTNVREATAGLKRIVAGNEARVDRVMANLDKISADVKEITGDNKGDVREIVKNVRDITGENKEEIRQAIANLRDFSKTLKDETPELAKKLDAAIAKIDAMVGENREGVKGAIDNFRSASAKLDNTLESAGKVMAKIERGEGTLGKLVNDNTAHVSLTDTLDGINRYVRKADNLKLFVDFRGDYLDRTAQWRTTANLKLQPAADKFYILGISSDPVGKRTTEDRTVTTDGVASTISEVKYTNDLTFNALLARRFSGLTVKGGMIQSTGGFGIDYDLVSGRLKASAEAFDFSRTDLRPNVRITGAFDIMKNVYLTGGADDLLNTERRSFFVGAGLYFSDDDLKTVIGAVPLKP